MLPPASDLDNSNALRNNAKHRRSYSGNNNIINNGNISSRRYAEIGMWKSRSDAFLEPYMQGLGPPQVPKTPDDISVTSGDLHQNNRSSALAPPFRLLELDGSGDSLDQDRESSLSSAGSVGSSSEDAPCDIGLVERLIRTHPVWFLPGIQRAGAFHLLQGKEEGNFVVRQSSQPDTMAISVRLPQGKGPYIEHYLIQAIAGQLSLESSDNRFDSIPELIAHYSQCCDELPVQLTLPRALREARNRQQLSSLALLGQEFWRYPMANPRPPERSQLSSETSLRQGNEGQQSPPSSGSSFSSLGSGNNNQHNGNNCHMDIRTPTSELGGEPIILNLSPLSPPPGDLSQPPSLMSTFKSSELSSSAGSPSSPTGTSSTQGVGTSGVCSTTSTAVVGFTRGPRPTPPNTLNLICTASCQATSLSSGNRSNDSGNRSLASPPSSIGEGNMRSGPLVVSNGGKTPPPPPPRWAKPAFTTGQNFMVTTTVTFSVNNSTPPPHVEVSCIQVPPKTDESTCQITENRVQHIVSPTSSNAPTADTKSSRSSKRHHRPPHLRSNNKESHHYQESDILDSQYYRSSVADKVSDYEDIWGPEGLSTFKPIPRSSPFSSPEDVSSSSVGTKKPPDLLERVGSLTSLNGNVKERNQLGLVINTSLCNSNRNSPMSPKQGSPFYAEPADALKQSAPISRRRHQPSIQRPRNHRHSDPSWLSATPNQTGSSPLERIDSSEELPFSSSVDNLVALSNRVSRTNKTRAKPVQMPRVRPALGGKSFNDTSWAVDSSWEFIGNEEGEDEEEDDEESEETGREERERRFPSLEQQETTLEDGEEMFNGQHRVTVQELIAQRFPELHFSLDSRPASVDNTAPADGTMSRGLASRMSSYDNVEGRHPHESNSLLVPACDDEDAQTVFSEPWDSSRWENLLSNGNGQAKEEEIIQRSSPQSNQVKRCKSFKEKLDPLLSPPRLQALRNRELNGTGSSIRAYALHLSADKSTTFAQNIDNFICCTKESKETNPQVVMRNMRQFMSGMKNYLVKHGEREFEKEVEKERGKLKANEFLNLDAILEGVMHKLVVRPLKEHLYRLFVDEYTKTGAIELLADNIQFARTKPLHELGIRAKILPPSNEDLETICQYLIKLQEVDSPLEKLENLLTCISFIFNSVKASNSGRVCVTLGADDFLPIFVWVLVQSGMIAAEIEAEYMWGLLHPSLLSGEGGYYLTTLSSAVHVLKNFRACSEEQSRTLGPGATLESHVGSLAEFRSVLKIVVPDEMHGSIITKTLPVRPNMTTKEVCKIIAHKVHVTNPQDYGLFKLVDGEETLLNDGECPQDVKGIVLQLGKHCMFAYKRIDAKIAWPRTSSPK